jgi:hypothetical protein
VLVYRRPIAEEQEGQIELGDTIFMPVKFAEEIQVVALTQTLVDVVFKTAVTIAAIVAAF